MAKDGSGEVVLEAGQAKLLHADQEIRLAQVSQMINTLSVCILC